MGAGQLGARGYGGAERAARGLRAAACGQRVLLRHLQGRDGQVRALRARASVDIEEGGRGAGLPRQRSSFIFENLGRSIGGRGLGDVGVGSRAAHAGRAAGLVTHVCNS